MKDKKTKPNHSLFQKLQQEALENEDIIITVDEDGEVEFEMDADLFLEFLKNFL